MKIEKKRYYGSTCHIVSFCPEEIRFEDHAGIPGKREHILKIFGSPKPDEVTWLRINRAFFNLSNPASENFGDLIGNGFINMAMKNGHICIEPNIPKDPEWNVDASYLLVENGKPSNRSIEHFSHLLHKNPRTFGGDLTDGKLCFIAADGRGICEKGLTSNEQRQVATAEGFKNCANFDGGGSSVIAIGDKIINKSYDGRGLGNIFVGYRKYTQEELPVLRSGRGVYVNLLQRLLNQYGYSLIEDGIWGAKTLSAVKKFQAGKSLAADGIVGKNTWNRLIVATEPKPQKPTLIIDAGHGGADPGGESGGYREKDLTLPVALRLKELLKEYNPALTRDSDIDLPVGGKREALIKSKYDYCLSLHFNINAGRRIECIHSMYSEKGKQLAQYIYDELVSCTKLDTGRVFSRANPNVPGQDYYALHKNTGSTTTVIVELLPLDRCKEYLNIEFLAQCIADGFKKYIANIVFS
jgi:N-acetylmuramoyl-L-alanine amidase